MPEKKKPNYRARRIAVGSAALVVLAGVVYVPSALAAPLPEAHITLALPDVVAPAAAPVLLPTEGHAIVAELSAGTEPQVIATSGSTDSVPIASITKVITALVTLDARPLDVNDPGETLTMGEADLGYLRATLAVDGSWVGVTAGQVLTVRDVLDIMLMESANNYAQTLTNWAFGTQEAYLSAANDYLERMGLDNTRVVDSYGLNPGNVSSTRDLMAIAELALANPTIAASISTKHRELPELGSIDNSNGLLGSQGIDGMKTGTSDEAGSCLLFTWTYEIDGQIKRHAGVVLGAPDGATARARAMDIVNSTNALYAVVPLVAAGTIVGSLTTPWGETANIVTTEAAQSLVFGAPDIVEESELPALSAANPEQEIGTLSFTIDGGDVASVPLSVETAIDDPGFWWRLTNPWR